MWTRLPEWRSGLDQIVSEKRLENRMCSTGQSSYIASYYLRATDSTVILSGLESVFSRQTLEGHAVGLQNHSAGSLKVMVDPIS